MKSSLFLAASGAVLAMAGPMRAPLDKRVMETDWVYEVVTVTVTAGNEPPAPTAGVFMEPQAVDTTSTTSTTSTSSSSPPPPPPPPPATTTTTKPAPPPPAPTTTSKAAVTTVVEQPPPATTTTASSDGGSNSGSGLGDYETTILDQHNVHRLNHSAPALDWDAELAQWASNTAKGCVFEHDM